MLQQGYLCVYEETAGGHSYTDCLMREPLRGHDVRNEYEDRLDTW